MSLPAPEILVPHRGEALLLDRIEVVRADGLIASLTVRSQLPTWAGPEIMAQAVSAFATIRLGQPYRPKPGLLLGLRAYRTEAHQFAAGTRLSVNVRESTRDEAGWAVFDSTLSVDGKEIADGVLTVFQPVDVLAALAEQLA